MKYNKIFNIGLLVLFGLLIIAMITGGESNFSKNISAIALLFSLGSFLFFGSFGLNNSIKTSRSKNNYYSYRSLSDFEGDVRLAREVKVVTSLWGGTCIIGGIYFFFGLFFAMRAEYIGLLLSGVALFFSHLTINESEQVLKEKKKKKNA